jgi:hypothetical protein
LHHKTTRNHDDERKPYQPVLTEVRLCQDYPEDTTLQDGGKRHPAHSRCDDEKPSAAAHECDEQARPGKHQESSLEPIMQASSCLRVPKGRSRDQTPKYKCAFEQRARGKVQ